VKRIFLLALLLVALATSSHAQTQTAICTAMSGTGAHASCSITVQPNQLVVVAGTAFAGYGVSDTNSWCFISGGALFQWSQAFADPNSSSHDITVGISVCNTGSHSGSETFTVNQSQFSVGASIVVTQWSGILLSGSSNPTPDSTVGNTGTAGSGGNITGGNLTTSVAGDLLLVIGLACNNTQTLTVGSGYTQDENYNYTEQFVGTYVVAAAEHQKAGAAGSYAANFTVSASGPWAIQAIALKTASSQFHIRSQVY
jgi:hypothetical protein